MRKHYDFANAVRNPHSETLKNGYTIIIHHKDCDELITVTKSKKPKKDSETMAADSKVIPIVNA